MDLTLVGRSLEVLDNALKLLNVGFQYIILVRERGNLLFFRQVLLLERFDFGLELLNLSGSLVGLQAELVHFLDCKQTCC